VSTRAAPREPATIRERGRTLTNAPGPAATTLLLGALLLAALALRLRSIDHGLPWAYNADEELHFVPIAVQMLGGSLNPGYFENPPALTYLLALIYRLGFADEGFQRAFVADPTTAYLAARVTVALIGTLVVGLVFVAGARFFDRRVGLVAAALIAFAFLPVFYSKQALNDVVTLVPVSVALVLCLTVYERGRALDWGLAGLALGAACAVKYTAGAMVVTLGIAALERVLERRDTLTRAALGLAGAGVAFALAFVALNPFAVLDFAEFRSQLGGQSGQASTAKLGQDAVPAPLYYAWTLTWGLGWAPALAALAGAGLALWRAPRRALLLLAFPAVFVVFLSGQGRFFARWILPVYPVLAIMAAYAAVVLADALPARPRLRPAVLAVLALALVAQGLVASLRVDRVLAREDTRAQARDWLERNVARGSRVVVEPFLPDGFLRVGDRAGPERFERWRVKRPFQAYEARLRPQLVERYRGERYCWVVTGSNQKQRGLKAGLPGARAYYARLAREGERRALFSPFGPGAEPVEFNYDLSFNYQPAAYARPGPVVEVYRLRGCG